MKSATQLFKALSDPTRLRLLSLLQTGELCVCDLMTVLGMPQSTVSRHLATLRHAGLVTDERRGQWMYYQLATDPDVLTGKLLHLIQTELTRRPQSVSDQEQLNHLRADKHHGCPE